MFARLHQTLDLAQSGLVVGTGSNRSDFQDLHLNRLGIDRVVLAMRADETYVHDTEVVVDPHDQPVLVAGDVEYNAAVLQDARRSKWSLNPDYS